MVEATKMAIIEIPVLIFIVNTLFSGDFLARRLTGEFRASYDSAIQTLAHFCA
jgi:hypothetical protein